MGWSLQGGLHTEYTSDFIQQNRGEIHCMFHDSLLPNLIRDLDTLHLNEPASPPHPRRRMDSEQLLEQFQEMRVEGRKTLFSALVDCAKGFLSAEERDQMANFIRPDPAPLSVPSTTTAPVVTTAAGMPLMAVSQLSVTTVPTPLPTTTVVVTAAVTPATTTPVVVTMTVTPPVVLTALMTVTPLGGVINSKQQLVPLVLEMAKTTTIVTTSGTSIPMSTVGTSSVTSAISGIFPPASQSHSLSGTCVTPSGSTCPVSHPIVIQSANQRLASGMLMGVEGLTLPSNPAATVIVMVARLVDPMGSWALLRGLASHQAAVVTSQEGAATAAMVIGTIHCPGLPRHITVAGGSTESVVSVSTSQGEGRQVFMIVEDDKYIV